MSDPIDYKRFITSNNPWWIESERHKLEFIGWLLNNITNHYVAELYTWSVGPKSVDDGTENTDGATYGRLCRLVWERSVGYDSGCSGTNMEYYCFVGLAIETLFNYNKEVAKAQREAQIAELEKKLAELRTKPV